MSESYAPVLWNRQKKIYDRVIGASILLFLVVFAGLQLAFYPEITAETIIIRATGILAFLMLHIILCIGPLARLNEQFLPILYNRRHFGVFMFLIALVHGVFNTLQFHALGNEDPILSIFNSNTNFDSLVNFPFQTLGFFALLILFVMAATSHDFWLKNLGPKVWKAMHMGVYLAYALIVAHVMLGVVQVENSIGWVVTIGIGMVTVVGLHLAAGFAESKRNFAGGQAEKDGFVEFCELSEIPEDRAKVGIIDGENIAVFKYEGKLSAINNFCKHQGGPLGEGKFVDGCVTCPWHGYQYLPHNGQSPPPFTEKVATYDVKLIGTKVFVNPKPHPEGTELPPVKIS